MQLEKDSWIKKMSERMHSFYLLDNGFQLYKPFANF